MEASEEIIQIAYDNIKDKFGTNLRMLKECWKLVKESHASEGFKN